MSTGGIGALLAINSATSATSTAGTSTSATSSAGSGSGSTSSSGDTTSVVDYPDGSTVTTVRDKAGQVVSITVTPPVTTASASTASSAGSVSSAIDFTA